MRQDVHLADLIRLCINYYDMIPFRRYGRLLTLVRSIMRTDPMPPDRIAVDIKLDNKPHVVGIGASAGGLEALSQFVAGLVPDLGSMSSS
jgi:chemotaxis response regulator CheB